MVTTTTTITITQTTAEEFQRIFRGFLTVKIFRPQEIFQPREIFRTEISTLAEN